MFKLKLTRADDKKEEIHQLDRKNIKFHKVRTTDDWTVPWGEPVMAEPRFAREFHAEFATPARAEVRVTTATAARPPEPIDWQDLGIDIEDIRRMERQQLERILIDIETTRPRRRG